jgi:hypothetical protein
MYSCQITSHENTFITYLNGQFNGYIAYDPQTNTYHNGGFEHSDWVEVAKMNTFFMSRSV